LYFVYCIRNKINNKLYIGWSTNYKVRWTKEIYRAFVIKKCCAREYHSPLSRAFRKYGKTQKQTREIFDFFVLEEFDNKEESLDAEAFWIEFFRTDITRYGDAYGYNQHHGGSCGILGYKFTPEQKKKMSLKRQGEDNSAAKLNWQKVDEIRQKYKSGQFSLKKLSKEYGVCKSSIARVISHKCWKKDDYEP
jgi:group I intron endonuclease